MRLHPFLVLAAFWSVVVVGIIVNLLSARIDTNWESLLPYAPWMSVVGLILAGATVWAGFNYRRRQASDHFALLKQATKLHPTYPFMG